MADNLLYVTKVIEDINEVVEDFSGSLVTLKDKIEILKSTDQAILEFTKEDVN